MAKKLIAPSEGPKPVGPYSPGVVANGFLFVSGQIPLNPATGQLEMDSFEKQARQALENVKSVVEAADSTLNDVVKVTIFLKDLANFNVFNEIYSNYFGDSKPARACIQAAALPQGVDVEVEAVALVQE